MKNKPRIYEVYMYKGLPVLIYDYSTTWLHNHKYAKALKVTIGSYAPIRIYQHDWDELIPVITKEGDWAYHSFLFKQHKIPKEVL